MGIIAYRNHVGNKYVFKGAPGALNSKYPVYNQMGAVITYPTAPTNIILFIKIRMFMFLMFFTLYIRMIPKGGTMVPIIAYLKLIMLK